MGGGEGVRGSGQAAAAIAPAAAWRPWAALGHGQAAPAAGRPSAAPWVQAEGSGQHPASRHAALIEGSQDPKTGPQPGLGAARDAMPAAAGLGAAPEGAQGSQAGQAAGGINTSLLFEILGELHGSELLEDAA